MSHLRRYEIPGQAPSVGFVRDDDAANQVKLRRLAAEKAVVRYDSELPSAYPALGCLVLSFVIAVLAGASARHGAWVLTVILCLVSLYFAYAMVTWARRMFRRR
jgi:hypothetical protein